MEFRRSITSGSSSARSGSYERNVNQERQPFFKKSTQSASSASEKHPESTITRIVVESSDNQQIIKEKTYTVIPKGQLFSYEDIRPGVSVAQDLQGNFTLKEIQFQVVDQQQSAGEEDAGSNDRDRDRPAG